MVMKVGATLAVLGFASAGMHCVPKSAEEVMTALRTSQSCPADAAPTSCECKEISELSKATPDLVKCADRRLGSHENANGKLTETDAKAVSQATWNADEAAKECMVGTPDAAPGAPNAKHDFPYPKTFGGTCASTGSKDAGSYACNYKAPSNATTADAGFKFATSSAQYNENHDSTAWCEDDFCWVDPCKCNAKDMAPSSWFVGAYYSYSQCGADDSYTAAAGCGDKKKETDCTGNCKWASDAHAKNSSNNSTDGATGVVGFGAITGLVLLGVATVI